MVAYTDENGAPVLSLRGSTQVYSDTQLCIWVRNAGGGIVRTMAHNNRVALLYRALETVVPEKSGVFFDEPTVDSLIAGIEEIDRLQRDFDPAWIREHAERFAAPRFEREMRETLARLA